MGEKYGVRPSELIGYDGTPGQRFFFDLRVAGEVARKQAEALEREKSYNGPRVPSQAAMRSKVESLESTYGKAPDAENVRKLLAA